MNQEIDEERYMRWLEEELRYARNAANLKPGDRKTARKLLLGPGEVTRMRQDKEDRLDDAGLFVQSEHPINRSKVYYPLRQALFSYRAEAYGIITEDEQAEATKYYTGESSLEWEKYRGHQRYNEIMEEHDANRKNRVGL